MDGCGARCIYSSPFSQHCTAAHGSPAAWGAATYISVPGDPTNSNDRNGERGAPRRPRRQSPDTGATRPVRLASTKEDITRQNRRGQRRMKARMDRDVPAVPDLEQRMQEQSSALQQAAALSSA
ncbi:hypothetical protein NDU88_007963 [Pleurodeles waltl]|uniref:Uncharacterized protein n=1 Tax=Pleurodeles waltl TaxID=8319 RepID=A0AAV7PQC8_PLEWA|nr:hypothetical protein NDU88_007963 [Pleurodeles waltl]